MIDLSRLGRYRENISDSSAEISSALGLKNSEVSACLAALSAHNAVAEEGAGFALKVDLVRLYVCGNFY